MTERLNWNERDRDCEVRESDSPKRPYPGVVRRKGQWEARYSNSGRLNYLGRFRTPELARQAVLIAQAEYLESKALKYRQEASMLIQEIHGEHERCSPNRPDGSSPSCGCIYPCKPSYIPGGQ